MPVKRKKTESYRLLYDETGEIGLAEFEKIVQCLVWMADSVVMPRSIRLSPKLGPDLQAVVSKLESLSDRGMIEFWDYASELGATSEPAGLNVATSSLKHVVSRSEYEDLYSRVAAGTEAYSSLVLKGAGRDPVRLDGISEVVSLQSALWSTGLAAMMNVDQILMPADRVRAFDGQLAKATRVAGVAGPVSETLMKLRDITGLWRLGVDDITYLRKQLPYVRPFLESVAYQSVVQDGARGYDEHAATAANRAVREYLSQLDAAATSKPTALEGARGTAANWTVSVSSVAFPALAVVSFVQPIISWTTKTFGRRKGLIYFMAELDEKTRKRANKFR